MELVERLTAEETDMLRRLYLGSFPVEERREWDDILARDRCGDLTLYGIRDDCGRLVGMVTVWHLAGADYVEHFAMEPAVRGGGLGSRAIRLVIERAGRPVVLEVERADAGEMARRRIGFYKRNGFDAIEDYDYVQPPYGDGLPWVPLMIMAAGEVSAADVTRELYVRVYGYDAPPASSD